MASSWRLPQFAAGFTPRGSADDNASGNMLSDDDNRHCLHRVSRHRIFAPAHAALGGWRTRRDWRLLGSPRNGGTQWLVNFAGRRLNHRVALGIGRPVHLSDLSLLRVPGYNHVGMAATGSWLPAQLLRRLDHWTFPRRHGDERRGRTLLGRYNP